MAITVSPQDAKKKKLTTAATATRTSKTISTERGRITTTRWGIGLRSAGSSSETASSDTARIGLLVALGLRPWELAQAVGSVDSPGTDAAGDIGNAHDIPLFQGRWRVTSPRA